MGKKDKKNKNPPASTVPSATSLWEAESTTNNDDDDEYATSVITDVELKDSLEELDERTDLEKELFELITEGDIVAVRQFISEQKQNIDVNHKDLQGHDVLTHAVESGKKKLVALALGISPANVDIKEALLHAIRDNRMGIVLKLLYFEDSRTGGAFYATTRKLQATQSKWDKKAKKGKQGDLKSKIAIPESFDESSYGNDITPLMMAAKHGHYEIMQVLHNRGERLPLLHMPSCSCPHCKGATRDMERSRKRINLLQAMANPSYMIFMSGQDGSFDPVYEAFELCDSIQQCADEEPEFKEDYDKILEDAMNLPLQLLSLCRTTEETKIFLSQKEGYIGPSSMPYPRLAVAIEMDHKEIVAHPNVQFLLQNEFNGPIWKSAKSDWERGLKMAVTGLTMLLFPVVQLFLWLSLFCCSGLPVVKYLMSPRSKAMSTLGSYIFFCVALFYMNSEERSEADIEPPTMYIRWLVLVYVISLLLSLFRRFMLHPGVFLKSGWNIFDCITQVLFWISFGLWIYLFIRKSELGFEVSLPRRKLSADDPLLLEECAFSVASTFATLRLLRWFVFSPFVGPFQAGMYRMADKFKTVLFFVAWVVLTFSLSSNIIFRPYANLTKYDDNDKKTVDQPTDLSNPHRMFLNYFVGELGPGNVEIFPINRTFVNADGQEDTVENEHVTTQYFATIICAVWNVVGIAFLKDSTVGLFGSTGEEVLQAKDQEWKYDRAKEMLHYIQDGHLAPPFNLIPNGACLASMFGWISAMTCAKGGKTEAGCNLGECCYLRDVESPEEAEEHRRQYPWLLRTLFQRYFKNKGNDVDDKAQKGDVEEVREQVKELKELCRELLGFKTPQKRSNTGGSKGPSGVSSKGTTKQDGTSSSVQVVVSPKARNLMTP